MLTPEHTVPSGPVNSIMKQFKETIHPKMETHSVSAQLHADGKLHSPQNVSLSTVILVCGSPETPAGSEKSLLLQMRCALTLQ